MGYSQIALHAASKFSTRGTTVFRTKEVGPKKERTQKLIIRRVYKQIYHLLYMDYLAKQSESIIKMESWTHLIRFVAVEDGKIHLGQLADSTRDVGEDSRDGYPIYARLMKGSIYNGKVEETVLQVRQVRLSLSLPRKR